MSRRVPRQILLASGAIFAGLLPLTVFVGLSHRHSPHEADVRRSHFAQLALNRSDLIFGEVDRILRTLATQVQPRCNAASFATLRKAVYDGLYIRETGLIFNQAVQCTSQSVLKPPMAIRQADHLVIPDHGIYISAAAPTLDPEPSIIVFRRVDSPVADAQTAQNITGAEVDALINPAVFGEALQQVMADEQILIRIERTDGALLARFGPDTDAPKRSATALHQTTLTSAQYPVRVIATSLGASTTEAWLAEAALFGSLGLLLSATLFVLGSRFGSSDGWMDAELRDALADDQFEVHYQPVIEVASGRCIGAEALLRWQHPRRGLILPGVFSPLAEQTGFMVPLTEWLLQRIATETAPLFTEDPRFHVSLNLSARHILASGLLAAIRRSFDGHIPIDRVMFEITEQELLGGDDAALMHLTEQLRDTGAKLALDDFGTGYSSLKYLTQFRFDYLKIDKIFVDAIGSDSITAGLVDAIIDIARRLDLKVIAEGVETQVQLDYLQRLGVPLVQGWLFSKALPMQQFKGFFASHQSGGVTPSAAPPA